ncbi:MAG: hypothetical protein WC119_11205, partial [Synergistaceae bacterium]
ADWPWTPKVGIDYIGYGWAQDDEHTPNGIYYDFWGDRRWWFGYADYYGRVGEIPDSDCWMEAYYGDWDGGGGWRLNFFRDGDTIILHNLNNNPFDPGGDYYFYGGRTYAMSLKPYTGEPL